MIRLSIDQRAIELEALILDMDGVLVDTEPIHMEAFKLLLEEMDLSYTDQLLRSFIGFSIEDNIKDIIEDFNLHGKLSLKDGVRHRDEIYLDLIRKTRLSPNQGVLDIIYHCIRNNVKIVLASSSTHEQINTIIDNLSYNNAQIPDLREMFYTIVSGDDVIQKKPSPEIYNLALSRLNISPQLCLAIEDSPAGVQSAIAAGLYTIALVTPYVEQERLKNAHSMVNSVTEVVMCMRDFS